MAFIEIKYYVKNFSHFYDKMMNKIEQNYQTDKENYQLYHCKYLLIDNAGFENACESLMK